MERLLCEVLTICILIEIIMAQAPLEFYRVVKSDLLAPLKPLNDSN